MNIVALSLAAGLFMAGAATPLPSHAASSTAVLGPNKLTELIKIDERIGTGKLAAPGKTVTIHYTGWLYAPHEKKQRGAMFDSSAGGAPQTFKLGAGTVIKGWEEGIVGMLVGGKRILLVPPSMGFGGGGLGPVPPTASLVFEIELVSVK